MAEVKEMGTGRVQTQTVGGSQGMFQFFSGGSVKDRGQWLFLVSSHTVPSVL